MENQIHLITTTTSTFKHMTENIRLNLDNKPMEDIWWDAYSWYTEQPEWEEKRNLMIEGLFHQNQISYIGEKKG